MSETQAEVVTLKTSNEEMKNKITDVCGEENLSDIKKTLAGNFRIAMVPEPLNIMTLIKCFSENIDILDGLVRRILSYQCSIDESDDDEDFNITHSEFRQSIMNDKNRTMSDLNTQMKSIRTSIDDIEANLACQACQVQ